ncbi:NAC domain-containing protein 69 [Raphanus sativus]|uniref:NAC domain-containing protein 69 n=1 Tax=Raphanus sativus TaxID=3726 RepID=A0A6J0L139_RAPSA|nr:NAC domain-containing protein 69 [Raphanus sativus]
MEKNLVGYRFSPTGEEVINYYLKNKILDKPWLVDQAIREINIYAYNPEFLPSLSKIESNDLVWYFFCRRECQATDKKKGTKRTTPSGFWKATGKDRIIKEKRGHGVEIGIKKTLVYHHGKGANGVKTPWVIHEYHITSLPLNQRKYVICQVKYKGEDSLYGNNSNELSHSTMVSDLNTARVINTTPVVEQQRDEDLCMSVDDLANPLNEQDDPSLFDPDMFFNDNDRSYQQPLAPYDDDDNISELLKYNGGNHADVLGDLDIILQEHRNDHKPKKALTGNIVDCSSGSDDAESICATSYQGTSSPDSVHSLSAQFHTSVDETPSLRKDSSTDIQPHAETSINRMTWKSRRTVPSKLEVKEGKSKAIDASMDNKKGWFITEEAMQRNHKIPPYHCLMNMIVGFILLVAFMATLCRFY